MGRGHVRQFPISDVVAYLQRVKGLIENGSIVMLSTHKNRVTSAKLGLKYSHQLDILRALTPQNYYRTYDPSEDEPDEAWAFGVREQSIDIYIKFVIEERTDTHDMAVCISFHEAEFPLHYPYSVMEGQEEE